jgi:hypothetical protein
MLELGSENEDVEGKTEEEEALDLQVVRPKDLWGPLLR